MTRRLGSSMLALTACLLMSSSLTFAQPAPTNQELDQRLRGLERNMEQMLDLLRRQQGGPAPSAPAGQSPASGAASVAPSSSSGVRMGALNLDVVTWSVTEQERNSTNWSQASNLPTGPRGFPAASAVIAVPAQFSYGAFTSQSSMQSFRSARADIGLQFAGVLQATASGQHVFQLQLNKADNTSFAKSCRAVLRLQEQVVVDAQLDSADRYPAAVVDGQGSQNLVPGLYKFSLWLTCWRYSNSDNFSSITATISVAAPGDRSPQPLTPSRLGIQQ